MRLNTKHFLLPILVLALFVLLPEVSQAAGFELFPGERAGANDYRVYVQNFYRFSIGAGILIATVLIMVGGIMWTTSAGNPGRIDKAKDYITDSIIGVVLLLGAYTILSLINPNLVNLKLPDFPKIDLAFGACLYQTTNADGQKGNKCLEVTKMQCQDSLKGGFTPEIVCAKHPECVKLNAQGFCDDTQTVITKGIQKASEQGQSPSQRDCEAQSKFGTGEVLELSGLGSVLDWAPFFSAGETKCKSFCSLVSTTSGTCDMLRAEDMGGGRYRCFCKYTPAS